MNTGKETWKWGVVVLLLAVFLITANQAYQHIANQEDYEAPDDWRKGDSWDQEHGGGPGAGQPMQVTPDYSRSQTTPTPVSTSNSDSGLNSNQTTQEQMIIEDDVNWNQNDSDSNQAPNTADSEAKNQKSDNNPQPGMYEIFTAPSVNETTSSDKEALKDNPTSNNIEASKENQTSNNTETVTEPVKEATSETPKQAVPVEEKTSNITTQETPTEVPAQPASETKNISEPVADIPAAQ